MMSHRKEAKEKEGDRRTSGRLTQKTRTAAPIVNNEEGSVKQTRHWLNGPNADNKNGKCGSLGRQPHYICVLGHHL